MATAKRGSSERRAREARFLFTGQGRWRMRGFGAFSTSAMVSAFSGSLSRVSFLRSVNGFVGAQMIMASQSERKEGEMEDKGAMWTDFVGWMSVGDGAFPNGRIAENERLRRACMRRGKSSSEVERSCSSCAQKREGVRPWDQDSLSSAAPWT